MARVVLNRGALGELLLSPAGPVGRDMFGRALKVETRGKNNSPYRSGALRASVHIEPDGLGYRIGSDLPQARYTELGTEPHVILPRNASVLRFTVAGGQVVFAKRVQHPGTPATHWLTRALIAGAAI